MRTVTETKTLYKWSDLNAEQQDKVLDNYRNINTEFDWWESVCDDAEQVGLEITEFELGCYPTCEVKAVLDAIDICKAIIENHGESCETRQTAENHLPILEQATEWDETEEPDEDDTEEWEEWYSHQGDLEEAEDDFLKEIARDYAILLRQDMEYLESDEAITETLIANDYEFTEDGQIYYHPSE